MTRRPWSAFLVPCRFGVAMAAFLWVGDMCRWHVICIMRACVRACAAFVRVLGAAVGVEGCLRGWLLHACTALEMGMGIEMEMESPVPGGCLECLVER